MIRNLIEVISYDKVGIITVVIKGNCMEEDVIIDITEDKVLRKKFKEDAPIDKPYIEHVEVDLAEVLRDLFLPERVFGKNK